LAAFSRLLGGQSMLYAAIAVLALVAAAVFLVRQRRRRTLMELEEWSSDQTIH
jgi:LPXTG-motif cell wall-anchored protein